MQISESVWKALFLAMITIAVAAGGFVVKGYADAFQTWAKSVDDARISVVRLTEQLNSVAVRSSDIRSELVQLQRESVKLQKDIAINRVRIDRLEGVK